MPGAYDAAMVNRSGIITTSFLSLALGLAGCLGDASSGGEANGAVGLQCSADLNVTGTFAPTDGVGGGTDPEDPESGWSCIPVGTWSLNVEVADQGDCSEVPILSQYVYTITEDGMDTGRADYVTVYQEDPNGDLSYLKVTIEGPCIGNFEHFSSDGTQVTTLRPFVDTDGGDFTIGGVGTYELFAESQRDNAGQ